MHRHTGERGVALILLLGITATLMILSVALVMLLVNQMRATANARTVKTSFYFAEAALDSGANAIKAWTGAGTFPTTGPPGINISQTDMNTEYAVACPSPAPTPVYRVYDNAATVDASTPNYDFNQDSKVWVEATVTYGTGKYKKTSRLRVLMSCSMTDSVLPRAVLYADTDIVANGTSDIYALDPDGNAYTKSPTPYWNAVTAGGNFTGNGSTNLAAPNQTAQSIGINVVGTISLPGITENGITHGPVGLLSDYIDQGRQYAMTTKAQSGMSTGAPLHNDIAAPTAPTAPTKPVQPGTTMPAATASAIQAAASTGYTATTDLYYNGSLTITAAKTFAFKALYVTGSLTVTGNATLTATSLYVGGLTGKPFNVSGATTHVTDSLGQLYVAGAASVTGNVTLTTSSVYTGGSFTLNPSATATDSLGQLYAVGGAAITGSAPLTTTSAYTGGSFTFNPSASVSASLGQLYAVSGATISGTVPLTTTSVYTGADFTITGPTASTIDDSLGPIYAVGTVAIVNNVNVTATDVHGTGVGSNVDAVMVTAPGSNYTSAPTVVFSGGGGTGAAATAIINSTTRVVTSVRMTSPGSGYTSLPSVSFSGGGGSGATATAVGCGLAITAPAGTTTSVADSLGSVYCPSASIAITGNAVMVTTDLYTGANFSISGGTMSSLTDQFGPIYVAGKADWSGGSGTRLGIATTSAVTTKDVNNKVVCGPTTPGPMFAQILMVDGDTNGNYDGGSGAYDLVLGYVWVDGNAGTGNVAVNFSAPSTGTASTIMCPLLATTEKTVSNGFVNCGTLAKPMVYYMQCDNDGLYSNTCEWASTGTFTGLMVLMEAPIVIGGSGNNDGTHPSIIGSVMDGTPVSADITLSNNASVAYDQRVIANLPADLLWILNTNKTDNVPGTWQQLSAN